MKKNIDIFISVVDNYGDMGFLTEILFAFHHREKDAFVFSIWTDAVDAVSFFLEKNQSILPGYRVLSRDTFPKDSIPRCILSLFHSELIPFTLIPFGSLILRIDYISFDRSWCSFHESEHIQSVPERRIIEIVPAPFPDIWGGIMPVLIDVPLLDSVCLKYSIDRMKKKICIFSYKNTLDRIDFSLIPTDSNVYILGQNFTEFPQQKDLHVFSLPFLRLDEFHALLSISDWSIIRGEVSFANILSLWKPFFWDMYKEIWGFYTEQNDAFLENFAFSDEYHHVHTRLNNQEKSSINLIEMDKILMNETIFLPSKKLRIKNLFTEIKKHIDRFEFSI